MNMIRGWVPNCADTQVDKATKTVEILSHLVYMDTKEEEEIKIRDFYTLNPASENEVRYCWAGESSLDQNIHHKINEIEIRYQFSIVYRLFLFSSLSNHILILLIPLSLSHKYLPVVKEFTHGVCWSSSSRLLTIFKMWNAINIVSVSLELTHRH